MTRNEYLQQSHDNGESAHRAYFGQFVNTWLINFVVSRIGADRIKKSTNPHFNDIPLKEWDNLTHSLPQFMQCSFKSKGDYATLAGLVCVAKEAAKQFKENQ